jgi:serine/threonine protein kinase
MATSIGNLHRLLDLGRGGMARVWLAVSTGANGFRKLVVVKQLRPEFTDNDRVRLMFVDEARLAAKLNHPNTVQTLEVTEQDGEFFIVMEYLDGQPLDAIQRQGPVPMEALLAILIDVCAGLHHAHESRDLDGTELGVVHRDVSPQNIFVTYAGDVKVVDFGIAKTALASSVSQSGEIKGKINYMAPEQALGMAVDRRADIFSIGVILYSALSGRKLWDGTPENRVIERLRLGDIPALPVRTGLGAPPVELVKICNRCIAPAARDRYATALEVQTDLEVFAKSHGGAFARRELGAFLSRSFEAQRSRRRSVIEEKVRALSDGTLIADAVRRGSGAPSERPKRHSSRAPRKAQTPPPLPTKRRSSQNLAAVPSPTGTSQQRDVALERGAVSSTDHGSTGEATKRPPPSRRSGQPSGASWRMPEPYKLVSRLSQTGLIFEAKDLHTKRGVTVQLLKGALSADELALRYGPSARLRHPNTVRLIDVGSVKHPVAVTYIVRENVIGETLATTIAAGRMPFLRVFKIAHALLASLADAHEHGVVHGRLTPEHILLESNEVDNEAVKVLGYWPSHVAVSKQDDESYRAPETLDGQPQIAGDLFAVGQVMFACITGAPWSIGSLEAGGPLGLSAFLRRALDPEPAQRFQSAREMQGALRQLPWESADEFGDPLEHSIVGANTVRMAWMRDRYLHGAMPKASQPELRISRNDLLSKRKVSLWVLSGDPGLESEAAVAALGQLSSLYEVRHLGEADRELAIEELSTGKEFGPWVVVFGAVHVQANEPLLGLLRRLPEVSQLLVSEGDDFALEQKAVNEIGLDATAALPCTSDEIVAAVDRLIERTRYISEGYDTVRQRLREARDELGRLSRELTAVDPGE